MYLLQVPNVFDLIEKIISWVFTGVILVPIIIFVIIPVMLQVWPVATSIYLGLLATIATLSIIKYFQED